MQKYLSAHGEEYFVYNIQTFFALKDFFSVVPSFYTADPTNEKIHEGLHKFLRERSFWQTLKEIRQHSASEKMFVKRFFNWFDGFVVLKFMHFARQELFKEMEIRKAAIKLLQASGLSINADATAKELLLIYRKWERGA